MKLLTLSMLASFCITPFAWAGEAVFELPNNTKLKLKHELELLPDVMKVIFVGDEPIILREGGPLNTTYTYRGQTQPATSSFDPAHPTPLQELTSKEYCSIKYEGRLKSEMTPYVRPPIDMSRPPTVYAKGSLIALDGVVLLGAFVKDHFAFYELPIQGVQNDGTDTGIYEFACATRTNIPKNFEEFKALLKRNGFELVIP